MHEIGGFGRFRLPRIGELCSRLFMLQRFLNVCVFFLYVQRVPLSFSNAWTTVASLTARDLGVRHRHSNLIMSMKAKDLIIGNGNMGPVGVSSDGSSGTALSLIDVSISVGNNGDNISHAFQHYSQ